MTVTLSDIITQMIAFGFVHTLPFYLSHWSLKLALIILNDLYTVVDDLLLHVTLSPFFQNWQVQNQVYHYLDNVTLLGQID